jgi:membrane fusion protein (multidrug efflux system)
VLEGLEEGDRVVAKGLQRLRAGQRVTIQQDADSEGSPAAEASE